MSLKFEFILIGVGLNDGTVRGTGCQFVSPDCPRGVPTYRAADDAESVKYKEGFVRIQGEDMPEVLGGLHFDDEPKALAWLDSLDGLRFKSIFLNVYLVRVVAKKQ